MSYRLFRCFLVAATAIAIAGCGGSQAVLSGPPSTPAPATSFADATNNLCVTPQTQPQTVALPATGGVSGTISFGAFPDAASGCDVVIISTGTDVENSQVKDKRAGNQRKPATTTTNPQPILTVSVGEAFNAEPIWGTAQIVTGMQLNVSPNLNFPDGTYYATITDTGLLGTLTVGPIPFVAKNGVLTVAPNGTLPFITAANSSAVLKLYGLGVIPTASPSPSPAPTGPTPAPSPTAAPSAAPTGAFNPTISLDPSACIAVGTAGATLSYSATVSQPAPAGDTYYYAWEALALEPPWTVTVPGVVTTGTQYGTLGLSNTATVTIPPFPTPQSGQAGETGTMVVTLFHIDPNFQSIMPVQNPNGGVVAAGANIADGTSTCP